MWETIWDGIEHVQLAFIADTTTFTLRISRSGHNKLLREHGLEWRDCVGGWIFVDQGKIVFNSGTLGRGSDHSDSIKDAIERRMKRHFREV